MLLVLVAIYGSVGSSVLTLQELNIQAAAVMTLLLVAAGQTIVILLGGIDLSVGGIVSLTTALAATRLGGHGVGLAAWLAAVVLLGPALGALNGLLVVPPAAPAVHRHPRDVVGLERRRAVDPPDRGRDDPRRS